VRAQGNWPALRYIKERTTLVTEALSFHYIYCDMLTFYGRAFIPGVQPLLARANSSLSLVLSEVILPNEQHYVGRQHGERIYASCHTVVIAYTEYTRAECLAGQAWSCVDANMSPHFGYGQSQPCQVAFDVSAARQGCAKGLN